MPLYNADLHIHSPYSIAVSQKLSVPALVETAHQKGLHILATGDITQESWRRSLQEQLSFQDGVYWYRDIAFILGTELEDNESIHHVVFLPNFHAAEELQKLLDPFVKNIDGRWAGRPHVHKSPAEIVDLVEEVGGICGPAHAFTPFKSFFRQGKFDSLKDAYQDNLSKIAFIELGLSADTNLADRIEELSQFTFLSNSDAHSQEVWSLGREFNKIEMETPSFGNLKKACFRRNGAKVVANAGLDPRLGKYYKMFCAKCRRRVLLDVDCVTNVSSEPLLRELFHWPKPEISPSFLTYTFSREKMRTDFLKRVYLSQVECSACKEELLLKQQKQVRQKPKKKKKTVPKLKLGVSERIDQLATWPTAHHPDHRPPYYHIVPLFDILRFIFGIASKSSKTISKAYSHLISQYGPEYNILLDLPLRSLVNEYEGKLSQILTHIRNDSIEITPGGGGTFGELDF